MISIIYLIRPRVTRPPTTRTWRRFAWRLALGPVFVQDRTGAPRLAPRSPSPSAKGTWLPLREPYFLALLAATSRRCTLPRQGQRPRGPLRRQAPRPAPARTVATPARRSRRTSSRPLARSSHRIGGRPGGGRSGTHPARRHCRLPRGA